jgi:hypothetical protein
MQDKQWEAKPNTGSIFVNRKKMKDSHPDRTGDCSVVQPCQHCGKENRFDMIVSGWTKLSKSGIEYLSLALKLKEPKQSSDPF